MPEGNFTLSIQGDKNSEVQVKAKKGEVIYIKLSLVDANFPELKPKGPLTGRFEYESFLFSQNETYNKKEYKSSKKEALNESEQNFFPEDNAMKEPASESITSNNHNPSVQEQIPHKGVDVRASFSTGLGRRLGRLPEGLNSTQRNYINDLKSGLSFDAGLTLYFDEQNGIGLKINNFSSTAQANNLSFPFGGASFSGATNSNERMTFYGLNYGNRYLSSNNNNQLHTSIGLGFFEYLDKTRVGSRSFEIYHSTIGISSDISYDIMLTDRFFIGFPFSLFLGSASEAKLTLDNGFSETIDLGDDAESFTRIDFSVGLRYILFKAKKKG